MIDLSRHTMIEIVDELILRGGAAEVCEVLGVGGDDEARWRADVIDVERGVPVSTPVRDAFAEIVSAWNETLRCQSIQPPNGCSRPAFWVVRLHEHGDRPVCTFHLNRWRRRVWRAIAEYGSCGCKHCDREFTTLEECAAIRPP